MSLLTATQDDLKGPRGRPLPDRWWRGTIETAQEIPAGPGKQLKQRIGNIRTYSKHADQDNQVELTLPDGSQFRIGGRKAWSKFWTEHPNPKAQGVGNAYLRRQALSTGLMARPENGQESTLDFESWVAYADASQGQEVVFRSQQVPRLRDGAPAKDEDDQPIIDIEVADYLVE